MENKRENFGSRLAVIFAMAGSAIGLGNVWRFPFMVGEHGGAAFILIYILATLLVSLPVFICEVTIGRRSRQTAYNAMPTLKPGLRLGRVAGFLSVLVPVVLASYYSVIGGWSLEYFFQAASGRIVRQSPAEVTTVFETFISSPWMPLTTHLLFLGICAFIVARGVKSGIEKFSKVSIPVLFFLIVGMLVYSITLPGSAAGVRYMVHPDFSQINARSLAYALGQSFYSLSLGAGAIVTYGSYVKKNENIIVSSAATAVSDLLFAILAGLAVMPAVFAAGIEPGAGPGLVFQTIPFIFSSLGANLPIISTVCAIAFFLAITVAAITSEISLLEVAVSYLHDKFGLSRVWSSVLVFVFCGLVGALCSLSFGPLAAFKLSGMGLLDLFDWLCSNVLMLLLSLISVIFVGFFLGKENLRDELSNGCTLSLGRGLFNILYFAIKWVAPIAIALIFITNFIL